MLRIGLISDTHDLVRPEALDFLQGSDFIVHAGDICAPEVLQRLGQIAPVTAVRGNNDSGDWASELHDTAILRVGELDLFAIHDVSQLDPAALPGSVRVVVFGHSHKPLIEQRGSVLYVNPGSAGPRRFKLPISVAELIVEGSVVSARQVDLLG